MRTNEPRVVPSIRFLGYLSAAGAIGVALAACSSSLHIDPTGGTGTGTGAGGASPTTTTGGGGGGPVSACNSNPDCKTPEMSVCDTVTHKCTQCLVNSDCDQSQGLTCFGGACNCPTKGAALCPTPMAGLQCVDTQASAVDCGVCGHACFGACAAGKCVGPWEKTTLEGAPKARSQHVAVWADSKMVVWGGRTVDGPTDTGGVYDLALNTWTATSLTNAPSARIDATAVWDDKGKSMIVWGGRALADNASPLNTGAFYDPAKDQWTPIAVDPTTPSARWNQTGLWTGTQMIIWGGSIAGAMPTMDGALFDPITVTWKPIPALVGHRVDYAATWTDSTMFVWGGFGSDDGVAADGYLSSGSRYAPVTDLWSPITAASPPKARSQAAAMWTGSSTVVWGGNDGVTPYPPLGATFTNAGWNASNPGPTGRVGHSATVVTKGTLHEAIIWGGMNASGLLDTGSTFDDVFLNWTPIPVAPKARIHHSTVVNGKDGAKMIIWGGETAGGLTNTGAIFDVSVM